MYSTNTIYNMFSNGKRRECFFEIILEPLQAMIQISLLGFYPIGSLLKIDKNILYIQGTQSNKVLPRGNYNNLKDCLFYLLNAIVRFNRYYNNIQEIQNNNLFNLFNLLNKLTIIGINSLIVTYNQVTNVSLLHNLIMCKLFLESKLNSNNSNNTNNTNNTEKKFNNNNNDLSLMTDRKDIDDIFTYISKLYSIEDYNVIYNKLLLLEKNPQYYNECTKEINSILNPINSKIKDLLYHKISL